MNTFEVANGQLVSIGIPPFSLTRKTGEKNRNTNVNLLYARITV
jgi:hypothetical protein